jgi:hypothetical protein
MNKQLEGNVLRTLCGREYGWRKSNYSDDITICPTCRGPICEDDEVHDGYRGSVHAHAGSGSLGLAAHHYFSICSSCSDCSCRTCRDPHSSSGLRQAVKDINEYGGVIVRFSDERDGDYSYKQLDTDINNPYGEVLVPVIGKQGWVWIEDHDFMSRTDLGSLNWDRDITVRDVLRAKSE